MCPRQTRSVERARRSSKYTHELLAPIVRGSRSLAEVLRKLGLLPTGGNYRYIAARLRLAALDVPRLRRTEVRTLSPATLCGPRRHLHSVAQVLAKLGLPTAGRPHRELTHRLRELALDTSHFRGRGWSRGETKHSHPSVSATNRRVRWPDDKVFVENSSIVHGRVLVPRLLAMGWSYRCAWCATSEWRGRSLVLHIDHVNGVHNDNRLSNLRLLCPNCHSQTPTYCKRRR